MRNPDSSELPLHPVTQELVTLFLKHIDSVEPEDNQIRIERALLMAMNVHRGQMRGTEPYINHVLSVTNRIAKNMPKHPARIIAALFHDGPGDRPEELAKLTVYRERETVRERAFRALEERFGPDVRRITEGMTNPEKAAGLPADEKNLIYAEHVHEAIQDDDVFWTKLSYVYENALQIHRNPDTQHRLKLSRKYAPILPSFIERLKEIGLRDLPEYKVTRGITTLESALQNMQQFIAEQEAQ